MLYWAFVFLIVALVAGALGLGGLAGTAAGIARVLFGISIFCSLSGWCLACTFFHDLIVRYPAAR
jgi:uncharacterized membrane protein YtjA (UPF0391 family)